MMGLLGSGRSAFRSFFFGNPLRFGNSTGIVHGVLNILSIGVYMNLTMDIESQVPQNVEEYSKATGQRFRRTKMQMQRGLSRQDSFLEWRAGELERLSLEQAKQNN